MTFNPFGDFETQGYLRNVAKEKDPEIVRHLEHAAFLTGIDAALEGLAKPKQLSYSDLLETHKNSFRSCLSLGRTRSTYDRSRSCDQ